VFQRSAVNTLHARGGGGNCPSFFALQVSDHSQACKLVDLVDVMAILIMIISVITNETQFSAADDDTQTDHRYIYIYI
jgi:hypothetical protein